METAPDCGSSLRCCLCSTECASYRKLKKHYKREHQEHALMCCLFCKYVTVCQSDMKKHKKREHPKDRFTCSCCMFSTKGWNRWVQHKASAHPRDSLPDTGADPQETSSCEHLPATRPADKNLRLGLSLDTPLKSSKRKKFSKLDSTVDVPADSSGSTLQELQCPHCGAYRQRTGLEPDECPSCGLYSHPPDSLLSLGDPSTRKPRFICRLCEKQFAKQINLSYHMRTHLNHRPFECKYCEYSCSQKTTLEQHLRGHLGIKPYKCKICDYSTAYRSNLVFHAATHSIDRPFSCDFCKKKFKRKDHMSIHVKRKHADVM